MVASKIYCYVVAITLCSELSNVSNFNPLLDCARIAKNKEKTEQNIFSLLLTLTLS